MNKLNFKPVTGTRDYYPDTLAIRNWLFEKWHNTSKLYGFEQYDSCIVEHTDLYTVKGGDDITNEMFFVGHSEQLGICLRPELTPSLIRMVINLPSGYPKPIKWYAIGQCFRFETVTSQRKREHYQWNVDIIDGEPTYSDGELLALLVHYFKSIGLTSRHIKIKISHRMLLQNLLEKLNVDSCKFNDICNIIDKIRKISRDEIIQKLYEIDLSYPIISTILDFVNIKSINDLENNWPEFNSIKLLHKILNVTNMYHINNWLELDLSIVRGLSYYTGLVFEAYSTLNGINRAICGGGRYDNIMKTYGVDKSMSCIGFGMGDVVIIEILKKLNLIPSPKKEVEYLVVQYYNNETVNDNLSLNNTDPDLTYAIDVVEKFRASGISAILYDKPIKKLSNVYKWSDKNNFSYTLLLTNNQIKLKNMKLSLNDPNKEINIDNLDKYINDIACNIN